MDFEFIEDLTSDVLFKAYGSDLKQVFENAATAMFNVICDIKAIEPKQEHTININANGAGDLMIAWLQELIALVDIENVFISKFNIQEISPTHLKAKVYGEPIIVEKGGTVVKAITYHKFKFEKTKTGYAAQVSCDI